MNLSALLPPKWFHFFLNRLCIFISGVRIWLSNLCLRDPAFGAHEAALRSERAVVRRFVLQEGPLLAPLRGGDASAVLQEGVSAAWVPRDPLPECGQSAGRDPGDMNHTKGGLVIFTANSHASSRELGKRIAE